MLFYITRISIPSRAAQSMQILSMSKAFDRALGGNFQLISSKGEAGLDDDYSFQWLPQSSLSNKILRYAQFCLRAHSLARRNPESIVFTRDIAIALSVIMAGGRAIYEAHRTPTGAVAIKITRWMSKSRRFGMVAISQALADYYIHNYGMPRERTLVAHDGVFVEQYTPLTLEDKKRLRTELGLPLDRVLIVHSGSLYKGGAELFGSVATLDSKRILLLQIGGSDAERAHWKRHYAEKGVSNIEFVEHQPLNKVRLYQMAADLLLYVNVRSSPIHWCTSPLKLFEYMATGVPILGAAIGSVSEVIDMSNAFCYDPDVPGSIEAAANDFLNDSEGAKIKANRARQDVIASYSWYERARIITEFAKEIG